MKMFDIDFEDYNEKLCSSMINVDKLVEGSFFYVVDKGKKYEFNYMLEFYGDKKLKLVIFKIDGKDKKIFVIVD